MSEGVPVLVLASGGGSNFENLVARQEDAGVSVAGLITDNADAYAQERAARLNVRCDVIERETYDTKRDFEASIIEAARKVDAEFILLAGFMRILSPEFIRQFERRIINIHPSLLPAFKGADGIRDAYDYGVKVTGVTVHFVDAGIDTGEIIMQRAVTIDDSDTLDDAAYKIHQTEYSLYPEAIEKVIKMREDEEI